MIETLTAAEATERLRAEGVRISRDTLISGIQQGVFPFGDCVDRGVDKAPWVYIYQRQMEEWIAAREGAASK